MSSVSVGNTTYENKFRSHKIEFTLDTDVNLDSIKIVDTAQVRSLSDIAPQDQVNLYAIQMTAGEQFPPVVLWEDRLLDGNTRIHAARKAGRASLPAYRLRCKNERQARQIAASLNQTNGRRLNLREARMSAITMIEDGYSDQFVARELGVEPGKVRRWRKEEDTVLHAKRLGIDAEADTLSPAVKVKLSDIALDGPFRELVGLLNRFDVPSKDLDEMVAEVKKSPSEVDAVDYLRDRTDEWEPRGTRRRGTGRNPAKEAYRSIGALTKWDPEHWVDLTLAGESVPRWEALRALADAVLEEYARHSATAA